jgi:hypothetical protein
MPAPHNRPAVVSLRVDDATSFVMRLWKADAPLTGTGLLLTALVVPTAFGLWLDPRVITGAPAWMKPAKFALSTGIYTLTLAWIFTYLPDWPSTRRLVGRTTAAVLLMEVAVIYAQAWRGTTSHFNTATPLDAALFAAMGIGIFIQTAASVAVLVALWRQHFDDMALGWALRLGMMITIVGASTGALMTRPTESQLADVRATGRMTVAGAHTVGGPDGGPGLPVTGWSTRHGDVRVPHFLGLHAIQILPLAVLLLFTRRSDRARTRLTLAFAAVYALLFIALLIQALNGRPLVVN